ncbi:MAG: zinc-ribbon domain-containing protein [Pseudomonadota bacterium]|nr:zinc-ribbon domain-containing protein [Pseudomonadota bacterium]
MHDTLATRCSACGTVFRVVPDQLRVSDGWVRCGRCSEVFNAGQALLDAQTGEPRRWPDPSAASPEPLAESAVVEAALAPESPFETTQVLPPAAGPDSAPDPVSPAAETPAAPVAEAEVVSSFDSPDDRLPQAPEADEAPAALFSNESAEPVDAVDAVDVAGLLEPQWAAEPTAPPFDVEAMIDATVDHRAATMAGPTVATASVAALAGSAGPPHDRPDPPFEPTRSFTATPSFIRRAERAERWRRPGVRAALLAVLLLALLGLAAQVAYVYRDLMAARLAFTRPILEQGCAWLGCTVGPARVISGLTVESSGLLRVAETDAYQLSLAVRNRSGIDLAVPAVELSLTDSQGKLLARRVLQTSELGAAQAAVAAGRDLQLQATLRIDTAPVAGYTVELFYP